MGLIIWRQIRSRRAYLDIQGFTQYVEKSLESEIGPLTKNVLVAQVGHWKGVPQFQLNVVVDTKGISLRTYPVGPLAKYWYWISKGVPGHFIRPRAQKALRFRARYAQSSRSSTSATTSGYAFSKGHWWPGIVPRNFEKRAADTIRAPFRRISENIMRRAINRARRGSF